MKYLFAIFSIFVLAGGGCASSGTSTPEDSGAFFHDDGVAITDEAIYEARLAFNQFTGNASAEHCPGFTQMFAEDVTVTEEDCEEGWAYINDDLVEKIDWPATEVDEAVSNVTLYLEDGTELLQMEQGVFVWEADRRFWE